MVDDSAEKYGYMDPGHPNYLRWRRSRELSEERGKFVRSVVENYTVCRGLTVLDLGSGEGGTSSVFSEDNSVVSLEISKFKLKRQKSTGTNSLPVCGSALELPFKKMKFDLIIMQDVIEHLADHNNLHLNLYSMLKPGGIIFISTPNKFSLFNILTDPHWGLPFLSLCNRETIRKYFLRFFRKRDIERNDIAQLLSLNEVRRLFGGKFVIKLNTRFSVKKLLEGNKGIAWSDFHLSLIRMINAAGIGKMLMIFANDDFGIVNNFFNPTFYFIMKKGG